MDHKKSRPSIFSSSKDHEDQRLQRSVLFNHEDNQLLGSAKGSYNMVLKALNDGLDEYDNEQLPFILNQEPLDMGEQSQGNNTWDRIQKPTLMEVEDNFQGARCQQLGEARSSIFNSESFQNSCAIRFMTFSAREWSVEGEDSEVEEVQDNTEEEGRHGSTNMSKIIKTAIYNKIIVKKGQSAIDWKPLEKAYSFRNNRWAKYNFIVMHQYLVGKGSRSCFNEQLVEQKMHFEAMGVEKYARDSKRLNAYNRQLSEVYELFSQDHDLEEAIEVMNGTTKAKVCMRECQKLLNNINNTQRSKRVDRPKGRR